MFKKIFFTFLFAIAVLLSKAQNIESIHFNLYTDSLKKGTHNYINVDGKLSNGSWKPLTARELDFKSDYGKFEGNDLVLPENPSVKKVTVIVSLKSNPQTQKSIVIWIKQKPDPPLPAYDMNAEMKSRRKR